MSAPPVEPNNPSGVTLFPTSDGSDHAEGADVLPARVRKFVAATQVLVIGSVVGALGINDVATGAGRF
jgi:hypothetical protein